MRTRPVLLAVLGSALVLTVLGLWLLLRPVDPAGSPVPAPITVEERAPVAPSPSSPAPSSPAPPAPAPTDVVPPPPVDDDDDDAGDDADDDGGDDDDG